jgi:hypothetical protein
MESSWFWTRFQTILSRIASKVDLGLNMELFLGQIRNKHFISLSLRCHTVVLDTFISLALIKGDTWKYA